MEEKEVKLIEKKPIVTNYYTSKLAYPLDSIYNTTAEELGIDPKLVSSVVKYYFRVLKKWTNNPYHPASWEIEKFGTFQINVRYINKLLRNLLKNMKRYREEGKDRTAMNEYFKKVWRIRNRQIYHREYKLPKHIEKTYYEQHKLEREFRTGEFKL